MISRSSGRTSSAESGKGIAKDAFLFSFYAAGMRSSDVLQLRWSDIKEDRIIYSQQKKADSDGAELSIPLNQFTRDILERYDRSTPTVFNVLDLSGGTKAVVGGTKEDPGLDRGQFEADRLPLRYYQGGQRQVSADLLRSDRQPGQRP